MACHMVQFTFNFGHFATLLSQNDLAHAFPFPDVKI
jgi:hypothetical protein